MGFCSGTEIFDAVCEELLTKQEVDKKSVLKELIVALEDMDWDCQSDSVFWNNKIVQEIMRELHPAWFD